MSIDATRFVWKLSVNIITPLEKLILLAIADRCGERGECWPSIPRLAKDTNLSEDFIRRQRKVLIQKGILTFTGEYAGRSKQIPIMKLMIDEFREDISDPLPAATPSQQPGVPPADSQGYPLPAAGQNLKEEPIKEPNNNNKAKNVVPISKKSKNNKLSLNELKFNNPHEIPTQMIDDWMTVRKEKRAPITPTVWNRLNNELAKCENPIDAFEQMVMAGWQSFKAEWVNTKHGAPKESFFDNESTDWGKSMDEEIF